MDSIVELLIRFAVIALLLTIVISVTNKDLSPFKKLLQGTSDLVGMIVLVCIAIFVIWLIWQTFLLPPSGDPSMPSMLREY